MQKRFFPSLVLVSAVIFLSVFSVLAQQQQVQRAPFDVTNYRLDVQLNPSESQLQAVADVTFTPLAETRTVAFELNGSLKIESITRVGAATTVPTTTTKAKTPAPSTAATSSQSQITFVQDQVGVSDLGPSVKIDLGDVIPANVPVTLRFKYGGVLATAEGGPLLTKRLAYVGERNGYLMYAARWFPFHNYAADRATSDITISLPGGYHLVGYSDAPVSPSGGKYRFTQSKPALPGNFAYGRYTPKTLRFADYELQFYTKAGSDPLVSSYGETLGRALDFYTKQYGEPDSGKRLIIAQTDDETLDFYSSPGMIFIADKFFDQSRQIAAERLQREAAYQWWGQTVGLKSFDDAWLSQGLAEYSAIEMREVGISNTKLEALQREMLEKALTFEQTASLLRAPSALDDTSTAYQYIMFGKGAMVYRLLKETMGAQKFNQLLRAFLAQYRGKNASIDDFEKLATQVAGEPMRYFFARWVEGTGVPEFAVEYQIIRTSGGKFVTRGTIKQNYDNLRLPVDVQLVAEGEGEIKTQTVLVEDASADFNIESSGKPIEVVIDPKYKLLRISEDLKVSSVARRGIEQFKEGNLAEAQQQFEAALKLDRNNSWIYYNLGNLFLEQRNYDLAIDNYKATLSGNMRPSWLEVWANIKMGNAYDAKGDRTRAISAYKRAEAVGDDYDNAQEAVKRYMATPYDPRQRATTTAVK
ncbi:MAG TPA: M1 family aminopeptidase [Pyrinomonadaceae bacterium]|nr:M1 family aminopeptidase [Pyrinomonadaceae bacterium]